MEPLQSSPDAEQVRRRNRRSVAIALLLAVLVVLFYVMAVLQGPGIVSRP